MTPRKAKKSARPVPSKAGPKASRRRPKKSKATKILLRRVHLTYILAVSAVPLALIFYFIPKSLDLLVASLHRSASVVDSVADLPVQERAGLPIRLKIPAIGVDSDFQYVGLDSDGAMDSPEKPEDVGWFEPGPRPGEVGSAVIAGHYGWKNGIPAVFDSLHELRPGDKIYVEDDAGVTITFVMRESRRYSPNEDSSGVFGSTDGQAHLNLITCGGIYDKKVKSYSNRLVVFAEKE